MIGFYDHVPSTDSHITCAGSGHVHQRDIRVLRDSNVFWRSGDDVEFITFLMPAQESCPGRKAHPF